MTRAFRTFATFCGAAVLSAAAGLSSAAPVMEEGAAAPKQRVSSNYLVRMSENPVVGYRGGIAGYKATAPKRGDKINPNHPEVTRYAAYLDSRHDAALSSVGGGDPDCDWTVTRITSPGFSSGSSTGEMMRAGSSATSKECSRPCSSTSRRRWCCPGENV
jgi:hypothetical protein